jgi:hypothetical protein
MAERITNAQRGRFLAALRLGHTVSSACTEAGFSRRWAYDERDRSVSFANAWDDAIEAGTDDLEEEVRARALDRDDPRSYLLLMFLMKKRRPEFRDSFKQEMKVTHEQVQEISFSEKEIDEAVSILQSAKTATSQRAVDDSPESDSTPEDA